MAFSKCKDKTDPVNLWWKERQTSNSCNKGIIILTQVNPSTITGTERTKFF